jgi:hypothetical protein
MSTLYFPLRVGGVLLYVRHMAFEVFAAVAMKNAIILDVALCRSLSTGVSEERVTSVFRLARIWEREQRWHLPRSKRVPTLENRL